MQTLQTFCSSAMNTILSSCTFLSSKSKQVDTNLTETSLVASSQTKKNSCIMGYRGDSATPPSANSRILFVNGIRYQHDDVANAAQIVSKVFHNIRIDYAYLDLDVPTVWNVLRENNPHYHKSHIIPLATHIRKLLQESENNLVSTQIVDTEEEISEEQQKNQTKRILEINAFSKRRIYAENSPEHKPTSRLVIVAHSGGAAMLKAALSLLHTRSKQKIEVVTLGGAYQFGRSEVYKAHNIIHKNDWVPTISRLSTKKLAADATIEEVGSGLSIPMSGHSFLSPEYQGELKRILTRHFIQISESACIYREPFTEIQVDDDSEKDLSSCDLEEEYSVSCIDIAADNMAYNTVNPIYPITKSQENWYQDIRLSNEASSLTEQTNTFILITTKDQRYEERNWKKNSLPFLPGIDDIKV